MIPQLVNGRAQVHRTSKISFFPTTVVCLVPGSEEKRKKEGILMDKALWRTWHWAETWNRAWLPGRMRRMDSWLKGKQAQAHRDEEAWVVVYRVSAIYFKTAKIQDDPFHGKHGHQHHVQRWWGWGRLRRQLYWLGGCGIGSTGNTSVP